MDKNLIEEISDLNGWVILINKGDDGFTVYRTLEDDKYEVIIVWRDSNGYNYKINDNCLDKNGERGDRVEKRLNLERNEVIEKVKEYLMDHPNN